MDLDQIEMDEAAIRKLKLIPLLSGMTLLLHLLAKPGTVGRSGVKPGAAIRNAGDFTAINKGVVSGDPAPMVSEGVLSKFLKAGGRSRNAVLGLMEAARDAGDYDVVVDKFRFTKSQMDKMHTTGTPTLSVLMMLRSFVDPFHVTLLTSKMLVKFSIFLRQRQEVLLCYA